MSHDQKSGVRATMRAHVLERPGHIAYAELPRPEPGPGELVVRVRAALTCGTDVKAFLRGHPKFPMPTPFGHEFSGEVAAVGAGVEKFREGDPVMATPTAPCGRCYFCARQQENLCDTVMETMVLGAYAEYIKLPARHVEVNVYHKPATLSFAESALLEPLSCVVHGLELVPLRQDDAVVLIGCGAISLLHLALLRSSGLQRVAVVARQASSRTEVATRLGAEAMILSDPEAWRDAVLGYSAGRGADVVIECTGQVEVWNRAPSLARRGGSVVLFGGCPPETRVSFDTQRLHYEQLRVISPFHFTPRAVRRAYEALASGFPARQLISGSYPLAELPRALDEHRSGRGIKLAVVP